MSLNANDPKVTQTASPSQWISLVVVYLFIPLVLLVCGGDFGWWQAWVYSLLIVAVGLGGAPLGRTAASGLVGRTTKYKEGPKCENLGQSTCAVDGA